ncbi:ABC transporter substrate-binding protein [Cutibacterium granulosum]|uniref:ABC transporter substrate-binding protein n=1 Tax=Cutibacterium granulosum TaxID=33011 RepID=UPI002B232DFE|nr:ABC transporter substrate-binding protein [Cutibacterium granulosum]MEA5638561.1 ABC transporter substrate-binding protein [Cutibacterium granulosum]
MCSSLSRSRRLVIGLTVPAILLAGCAGAPEDSVSNGPSPVSASQSSADRVEVTNCGQRIILDKPATRAVTLNQGATENVLAINGASSLVGTAYLDGEIPAKWRKSYDSVKVLAKEYPSKETFLAAKPDLALSSFSSAFTDKAVGTRVELAKQGIATYVSPFGCPKGTKSAETTWNNVWKEMHEVGSLIGAKDAADKAISEQRDTLKEVTRDKHGTGTSIVWFDSGDKTPFIGAGHGGPQLLMDAVGAKNVFADADGGWADGSWEKIVASDPDVIVVADAGWSTAKDKIAYLKGDPVLKQMRAVKENKFVTVPFSQSTPGAELIDGAKTLNDGLAEITGK